MSTFFNDIKYGVRQMRKNPSFTVTAVIVLSLAIGGTTAMFTLVNALLLRPLPVKNPNQLVRLYAKENKPGGAYRSFSYPNMVDMRSDLINEKDDRLDARDQHHLFVLGRLKPGVTIEAAQSRMATMSGQLAHAYPKANKDLMIEVGRLARVSSTIASNPLFLPVDKACVYASELTLCLLL